MTAIQIDHAALDVSDVEDSIAFYCGPLGAEPVRLDEFLGGQAPLAPARIEPTLIDLFEKKEPRHGLNHLCIEAATPWNR